MKKFLLLFVGMFALVLTAKAETYTHTFKEGDLSTAGGVVTLSDITWTSSPASSIDWSNEKGIQLGKKAEACKEFSLTTSAFKDYKITSVTVYSCIASSGDAKLTIKAGNTTSTQYTLGAGNDPYTLDSINEQGDIVISWSATQRAYYVSKIEVEYELPAEMVDVEEPVFKTSEGVYENSVTVTAETADQSLVLYYTLDGTVPSYEDFQNETGTTKCSKYYVMYSDLKESATIKVIAVKVDGESVYKSDVVEASFTVSPTKPYIPANEITTGGRYALIANDSVADAFTSKVTTGLLEGRKTTKQEKYIETVEYDAFTFTATNGGYTIQDATGRYIYTTGASDEFLFAEEKPASGAVWSIALNNGKAEIKNSNRTIYYVKNEDKFGCYTVAGGDMELPSLYMVREYPKATITPESGSYVEGLKEFTIYCEEGIAVSGDFTLKAQSALNENRVHEIDRTYNYEQIDNNTLKFTIDEPLKSVNNLQFDLIITGDIYLNPDGMKYKLPIISKHTRSICSYNHTGYAATATIEDIKPANGEEVSALSYILFTFSNIATSTTEDATKAAKLYREGSTELIPFTFTGYQEDGVTHTAQNQGGLLIETPITANGTYILEIPDGYFIDRNSKEMKGVTLKYIVKNETGIEDIIVDGATNWVAYNLIGVKVLDTNNADELRTLPNGIYIINGKKVLVK